MAPGTRFLNSMCGSNEVGIPLQFFGEFSAHGGGVVLLELPRHVGLREVVVGADGGEYLQHHRHVHTPQLCSKRQAAVDDAHHVGVTHTHASSERICGLRIAELIMRALRKLSVPCQ